MSFFEFFAQYNIPFLVYILEYFEFFSSFIAAFIVFKAGKIGLSVGVAVFVYVGKLLFDNFWLYYVKIMPSGELTLFLWYNGYAFSSFIMIVLVYKLHERFRLGPLPFVLLFLFAHFFSMLLQIIRYVDRAFLESNHFLEIYKYGIPAMNILGLLTLLLGVYHIYHKSKQFEERIPWGWE